MRTTPLIALVLASSAAGQAPPSTDIHLFDVAGLGDERPSISPAARITDRDGYDNQPSFSADGKVVFYTSIRDGQADIYAFDLSTGKTEQVTATPESEYSPTPLGAAELSVVRVEGDGRQLLWRYPLAGGVPQQVATEAEPVGYHAWGAEGGLLLFVLGEPHTLQWRPAGGPTRVLASDIGRSLLTIPGDGGFSYVAKRRPESPESWWVMRLDPKTLESTPIIATPKDREDVAWDPEGRLWVADGTRLLRHCPACGGGWRTMVDLAKFDLGIVSRLAFAPNGRSLAVVSERPRTEVPQP